MKHNVPQVAFILQSSVTYSSSAHIFWTPKYILKKKHAQESEHFPALWMPVFRWLLLTDICTFSLCICPCTLVGLVIQLLLFTLQESQPTPHRLRPTMSTHGQEELEEQELQSNKRRTYVASDFYFQGEMKLILNAPVAFSVCVVARGSCNSPVWPAIMMEHLEFMEAWLSRSCCFMVVKITEIRWVKRLADLGFCRKKKRSVSVNGEWFISAELL